MCDRVDGQSTGAFKFRSIAQVAVTMSKRALGGRPAGGR